MNAYRTLGRLGIAAALTAPALASAQFSITAEIAPPAIPVYVQPVAPADGYLWTPGYWAYGPDGYYWVPGVWVRPPRIGVLWTPPWWGFAGGLYGFHSGYWGPRVGFYGGVNYGYGYGGSGYYGGRWQGRAFAYNTAVSNVNVRSIHNTYVQNVTNNVNVMRVSYNGGPGGVQARANVDEARAERQQHIPPTQNQTQHFRQAQQDRSQYANANGGRPQTMAMSSPRAGGTGNEVARRGQQQRIANGTRDGQVTPGEARGPERRDNGIDRRANADRAADGGGRSPQQRQQIRRQDNLGQDTDRDRRNANNDTAARQGRMQGVERRQAQQVRQAEQPRPQPRMQAQAQPRMQPPPHMQAPPRMQAQPRMQPPHMQPHGEHR